MLYESFLNFEVGEFGDNNDEGFPTKKATPGYRAGFFCRALYEGLEANHR